MAEFVELSDTDCAITYVRDDSVELGIRYLDTHCGEWYHATTWLTKQDLLDMLKLLEDNEGVKSTSDS